MCDVFGGFDRSICGKYQFLSDTPRLSAQTCDDRLWSSSNNTIGYICQRGRSNRLSFQSNNYGAVYFDLTETSVKAKDSYPRGAYDHCNSTFGPNSQIVNEHVMKEMYDLYRVNERTFVKKLITDSKYFVDDYNKNLPFDDFYFDKQITKFYLWLGAVTVNDLEEIKNPLLELSTLKFQDIDTEPLFLDDSGQHYIGREIDQLPPSASGWQNFFLEDWTEGDVLSGIPLIYGCTSNNADQPKLYYNQVCIKTTVSASDEENKSEKPVNIRIIYDLPGDVGVDFSFKNFTHSEDFQTDCRTQLVDPTKVAVKGVLITVPCQCDDVRLSIDYIEVDDSVIEFNDGMYFEVNADNNYSVYLSAPNWVGWGFNSYRSHS